MLNDSDLLARKTCKALGAVEALQDLYTELYTDEADKEVLAKIKSEYRRYQKIYADWQHKYIDSIGGNEKLKV